MTTAGSLIGDSASELSLHNLVEKEKFDQVVWLEDADSIPKDKLSIYVRVNRQIVKIDLSLLVRLTAEQGITQLYLANGSILNVRLPLQKFESALPEEYFVRVHKSHIVAVKRIDAYTRVQVSVAGSAIPIGRTHMGLMVQRLTVLRRLK